MRISPALLGLLGLFGTALPLVANETVRYATDGYGLGGIIFVASEEGFFKDQGIDPVIETYGSGVDTVDAVLMGNADFGVIIDLPLLTRFDAGKLVSPAIIGTPEPGYHKLYSRTGMNTANGFRGKTFGVATGTAQEFLSRTYLAQLGLDPDKDVRLLGFSDLFSIVGAMKSGSVDAAWIWGEGVAPISSDNRFAFLSDDSVVHQDTSALLATSRAYAGSRPELVVRTLKALDRASSFIAVEPEQAAEVVAAKVGADVGAVKLGIVGSRYRVAFAHGPVESLHAKYDFLLRQGKINAYDFASQFDVKALSEALPNAEIDPSLR
jgi:NitT/TauT family transport system substrate-binding protein